MTRTCIVDSSLTIWHGASDGIREAADLVSNCGSQQVTTLVPQGLESF